MSERWPAAPPRRARRRWALDTAAAFGVLCLATLAGSHALGVRPLIVAGSSMEPTLPLGSLAVSVETPVERLVVGDVVSVVRDDGARVTHRLVDLDPIEGPAASTTGASTPFVGGPAELTLQGDANPGPERDPTGRDERRPGRVDRPRSRRRVALAPLPHVDLRGRRTGGCGDLVRRSTPSAPDTSGAVDRRRALPGAAMTALDRPAWRGGGAWRAAATAVALLLAGTAGAQVPSTGAALADSAGARSDAGVVPTLWWAQGSDGSGQFGAGGVGDRSLPFRVLVPSGSSVPDGVGLTSMSVGTTSACAVHDGELSCWGANDRGQLGDATSDGREVPSAVADDAAPGGSQLPAAAVVTDVSVADGFACAVADGRVYCWGDNTSGQLGNDSWDPSNVPVAVAVVGTAGSTLPAGTVHRRRDRRERSRGLRLCHRIGAAALLGQPPARPPRYGVSSIVRVWQSRARCSRCGARLTVTDISLGAETPRARWLTGRACVGGGTPPASSAMGPAFLGLL